MNNDLISRSELKKAIESIKQNVEEWVNHTECDTTKALVRISLYEEFIDLIDNAPTVELFCSYLSDEEVRQPCIEAPCKHERPQTIDCTNCKHESKRLIDEPCKYCNIKYSEWEKKGGAEK